MLTIHSFPCPVGWRQRARVAGIAFSEQISTGGTGAIPQRVRDSILGHAGTGCVREQQKYQLYSEQYLKRLAISGLQQTCSDHSAL